MRSAISRRGVGGAKCKQVENGAGGTELADAAHHSDENTTYMDTIPSSVRLEMPCTGTQLKIQYLEGMSSEKRGRDNSETSRFQRVVRSRGSD